MVVPPIQRIQQSLSREDNDLVAAQSSGPVAGGQLIVTVEAGNTQLALVRGCPKGPFAYEVACILCAARSWLARKRQRSFVMAVL